MERQASSQAPSDGTLLVVNRAISVLTYVSHSDRPTVGVTEIAEALDISKPATHRILTTLRVNGLVELDAATRRYRLGPGVLPLAAAYTNKLDILKAARVDMGALSRNTAETVTLSVRTGWERIYVDQVTPDREVRMSVQIGRSFPLHAGSSGKAFLAFMPDAEVEAYLERPLERVTDLTVTDRPRLRHDLEQIRAAGFAQSFGERQPGASSTAGPILGADGRALAVMSVCGPVERFRESIDTYSTLLLETTRRLSARMGYRGFTRPTS